MRLLTWKAVLFAAVMTVSAFAVASADGLDLKKPACKPDSVFENEEVRIWFQGHKGHIKVFDNNDSAPSGHYQYTTGAMREQDEDGNVLASMHLGRAFPQTSTCTVEETDQYVNMTLAVTDAVRGPSGYIADATVTFAYNFNKSSNGAKFDLLVEGWPWQSDESELAYAFRVHSGAWTIEDAENGLGFRDDEGNARGYIEWAPNATATYEDGHDETAIVDSEIDNDGHTAHVVLRFTNATAGYTELEYDPWVGSGDYVIVAGVLIGLSPVENVLPRPLYRIVRDLV